MAFLLPLLLFTSTLVYGQSASGAIASLISPATLSCRQCKAALLALDVALSADYSLTAKGVVEACASFGEREDVCQGFVDTLLPSLAYALDKSSLLIPQRGVLDSDWICPIIAGECDFPSTLLPNVFPIAQQLKKPRKPLPTTVNSKDVWTVLHLSDFHMDPLYTAGTEAICDYPLCCRSDTNVLPSNMTGVTPRKASSWGDYNCDIPHKLADNMLASLAKTLPNKIDFALFTGDAPPHNIWETTKEVSDAATADVFSLLRKYIKVPLFPSLGNHESAPINQIPDLSTTDAPVESNELFSFLQTQWAGFLPKGSQIDVVQHQGAYSVGYKKNFRIISLNTVMCYCDNFYSFPASDEYDKGGQLNFLQGELIKAEAKGEYVWIISHVAPGDADCGQNWSNMYSQIVQRFQNTISAQFYGHTHRDEISVYYPDKAPTKNSKPFAYGLLAPSQTTYLNLNPGFRVYSIDKTTYQIVDSYTYITDASKFAQLDKTKGKPKYTLEYSARSYLPKWPKTAPLNSAFWHGVINAAEASTSTWKTYMKYRGKSAGLDSVDCIPDAECRAQVICDMRAGNSASACTKPDLFKRDIDGQEPKKNKWKKDLCSSHSHPWGHHH